MVGVIFTDKVTKQEVKITDIDREVCDLLGKEFSDEKWCYLGKERVEGVDWYNTVVFALALGETYDKVRELWQNEEIHKIVDMLEHKYYVSSYYRTR